MREIQSEADFEQLMLEIDAEMQAEKVPIIGRELAAMRKVAVLLEQNVPLAPIQSPPIPGRYVGHSLAAHVKRWIEARYGDRLKHDFSYGYSASIIRGDIWLLRIPIVYGNFKIVCERDLSKEFPNWIVNKPGQPRQEMVINLLKTVKDLPQGLASMITDEELRLVLNHFLVNYDCHRLLESFLAKDALAVAARNDLTSSAKRAVAGATEHGMSRWDSLQAAEKFLKLFIEKTSGSFPHTHNLTKLAEIASKSGLPPPPASALQMVQCDAGIRYEQRAHSLAELANAHQGAAAIGFAVAKTLFPNL